MDIQSIGSNRFLVGLSCDDLARLDITYESMDYSDIETRRVIWTILDRIRKITGHDIDPSGNLMIEASPDGSGGCILMFTVPVSRADIGTVISKSNPTRIFEFRNSDDLLDALSVTGLERSVCRIFTDGKKFRAELPNEKAVIHRHVLEEFGTFTGNDPLVIATTHEHWEELKLTP